eukprot:4814682-Prymnesium_polylepis.1
MPCHKLRTPQYHTSAKKEATAWKQSKTPGPSQPASSSVAPSSAIAHDESAYGTLDRACAFHTAGQDVCAGSRSFLVTSSILVVQSRGSSRSSSACWMVVMMMERAGGRRRPSSWRSSVQPHSCATRGV